MSFFNQKSELLDAMADLRKQFRKAAWFSFLSSLLVLMPSAYMLEVYDRVVNSRSHVTLLWLTVLVLGCYVLMEMLDWARSQLMHAAGLALDARMGERLFKIIFDANLRRVQGGTTQVLTDLRVVREFLNSPVVMAVMEIPVSVILLVLLFAVGPLLGWSAIAGAIGQGIITWLTERGTRPPLTRASQSAIAAQVYADGSLRNAQVIESMGMLRDIHKRWMEKQREFISLQALASYRGGGYQAVSKLIQNVLSSALLGISAWLLLHNELNGGAGMMIVGSVLGGRFLAPLVQIISQWRGLVTARDAWYRLTNLLNQMPARDRGMPLPPPRGLLTVENLVAGAPGTQTPILKGFSFGLMPGEILAVVGPSASGKTTLARLLTGIWPAVNGKVRLDGADVFTWDKTELGPHVGYLPQGIELFDGTLAENIARFGDVSMTKVEAAAKAVGIHDFIMGLPDGYDTQVGPDGARLSGGQRQRVALARAIYGDPVFVVLDEPNSNLDEAGDAALAATLKMLKATGTTFVLMTHRASILDVADKMMLLQDGVMQLFGPRDDVLAAMRKAVQAANPQPAQPAEASAQPA